MKKLFFVLCLVILTGCQNPAKNLQANIFGDLWDKYVVQENEDILKSRTSFHDDLNNYEEFAELNAKLDDLQNFLVLGQDETDDSGETEFQEGLMKLADKNNEALSEEFRGIINTFQKGNSSQESLEKEFKKLKSNIKRLCNKQKTSVNCGF